MPGPPEWILVPGGSFWRGGGEVDNNVDGVRIWFSAQRRFTPLMHPACEFRARLGPEQGCLQPGTEPDSCAADSNGADRCCTPPSRPRGGHALPPGLETKLALTHHAREVAPIGRWDSASADSSSTVGRGRPEMPRFSDYASLVPSAAVAQKSRRLQRLLISPIKCAQSSLALSFWLSWLAEGRDTLPPLRSSRVDPHRSKLSRHRPTSQDAGSADPERGDEPSRSGRCRTGWQLGGLR